MFLNLKLVMITTVVVLAGGILYIGPRGESVLAGFAVRVPYGTDVVPSGGVAYSHEEVRLPQHGRRPLARLSDLPPPQHAPHLPDVTRPPKLDPRAQEVQLQAHPTAVRRQDHLLWVDGFRVKQPGSPSTLIDPGRLVSQGHPVLQQTQALTGTMGFITEGCRTDHPTTTIMPAGTVTTGVWAGERRDMPLCPIRALECGML